MYRIHLYETFENARASYVFLVLVSFSSVAKF